MNERIKELKDLQSRQKVYIIIFVVYMLGMLFITYRTPVIGLLMHLLGFLFYIFFIMKRDRQYKNKIKQYTLEQGLRPFLKNITYTEKDGVDKNEVNATGFIPCSDLKSMLSRDTITAIYKNAPVIVSDLVSMVNSQTPNKKGKTVNTNEPLIGVYFEIQSSKIDGPEFLLWPKDVLPEEIQNVHFDSNKLNDDIYEFRKAYNFYLSSSEQASEEAALSPEFVKAITLLADNTSGKVACQMTKGKLQFFIIQRFMYNVDIGFKTPISTQMLNYVSFPEISYILRAVDCVM